MRRVLVLACVLALATACGGKRHTDVLLRATRPDVDLDRAAAIVKARLRDFGVDASVRPRGDRELVVRLAGRDAVDGGVTRAGDVVAVYDLEGSVRPDPGGELACGPRHACPGVVVEGRTYRYHAAGRPAVRAAGVSGATVEAADVRGPTGEPDPGAPDAVVVLHLTRRGRRAFHTLTRRIVVRGNTRGTAQHFAVVYAGRIVSWPSIDYGRYPDGIDGDTIGFLAESARRAGRIARAIDLAVVPGFRVEKS